SSHSFSSSPLIGRNRFRNWWFSGSLSQPWKSAACSSSTGRKQIRCPVLNAVCIGHSQSFLGRGRLPEKLDSRGRFLKSKKKSPGAVLAPGLRRISFESVHVRTSPEASRGSGRCDGAT